MNERIVCADGFAMSVQARALSYCEPRIDNAEKYTSVEVGYPSEREEFLMPWVEDSSKPTGTVYAYVPVGVVSNVIIKHGGLIAGEAPAGVLVCRTS
tara:strand:+ start:141 stop:431 length:291 start_codon:yes stop_codon:yes gene_type:complete